MRDLKKIKSQQSIIGKKYASKKYDQFALNTAFGEERYIEFHEIFEIQSKNFVNLEFEK